MKNSNHLDAWATFLKSYNRLHQGMEEKMKSLGHPSLEIYDVLWTLEQSTDQSLRFVDLGKKVFLSRYNVSRLVERLEKLKLIETHSCPVDKRGVFAKLTAQGKKLRREMWKNYSQIIADDFSLKLTKSDHAELIKILKKVWSED